MLRLCGDGGVEVRWREAAVSGAILLCPPGCMSGDVKYARKDCDDPGGGWDDPLADEDRVV